MIQAFKRKLPILSLVLVFFVAALLPVSVHAQTTRDDVCRGVGVATGAGGCGSDGEGQIDNIVATVVNILSTVVGIVAVIMIIIGGFKYVTSGGDSSSISNAKQTILYAIVGLIVAGSAQIIVNYVIGRAL